MFVDPIFKSRWHSSYIKKRHRTRPQKNSLEFVEQVNYEREHFGNSNSSGSTPGSRKKYMYFDLARIGVSTFSSSLNWSKIRLKSGRFYYCRVFVIPLLYFYVCVIFPYKITHPLFITISPSQIVPIVNGRLYQMLLNDRVQHGNRTHIISPISLPVDSEISIRAKVQLCPTRKPDSTSKTRQSL